MSYLRGIVLFLGVWLGLAVVRAHDPGISTAQAELRAGALAIDTGFSPTDAEQLLPPNLRSPTWSQAEFDAARGNLQALAPQLWEVRAGDTPLTPRTARVELLAGDNINFHLEYAWSGAVEKLTLRAPRIPELPQGHRQFVIVSDERGLTLTKKLLSTRDFTIEVTPGAAGEAAPAELPTFWGFLWLGVTHIWTGYDHLLFLFALLVVCRSLRSIVTIISCFTIAHSITLGLATLHIVNLPSRFVEPAIAASIVFVGLENLLRRGEEPRGRWALTFAFGLIHGFGFASVLRDLGVGRGGEGIAMPLFTFNLGVELGQIAIAALVLPLVWQLRKSEAFVRRGVPILSGIVTLAGTYWLVTRLLGR